MWIDGLLACQGYCRLWIMCGNIASMLSSIDIWIEENDIVTKRTSSVIESYELIINEGYGHFKSRLD